MKFSDKEEQQLRRWASMELEAIGQQNPDALSKIIVSSVNQDKSVSALKAYCISQLQTFLKSYTEDFVEVLFQAIEDGTYQVELEDNDSGDHEGDDDRDISRRGGSASPAGSDEEDRRHRNRYRRDSSDNMDQLTSRSAPSSSCGSVPKGNYSRAQQDIADQSQHHGHAQSSENSRPAQTALNPQQFSRGIPGGGRTGHYNKHYRPTESGRGPQPTYGGGYLPAGGPPLPNDSASYNPYASSMYPGLVAAGYGMGFPNMTPASLHSPTNAPGPSYGWAPGMQGIGQGVVYPGAFVDQDLYGEYIAGVVQGKQEAIKSPLRTAENTYVPSGPSQPAPQSAGEGGGTQRPPPPPGPAPSRTTALEVMANVNATAGYGFGSNVNVQDGLMGLGGELDSSAGYGFPVISSSYGAAIQTHNGIMPNHAASSGDDYGAHLHNQQSHHSHLRGGTSGGFQPKVYYPPLPEHERCTVKVTGIPSYVTEMQLREHFEDFGHIVELQLTEAPPSKRGAEEEGEGGKKRIYFECLVQFYSAANCKKCISSPRSVLDNRYIQVRQSFFNIIPPGDVAHPGDDVIERDASILSGTYVNPNKSAPMNRKKSYMAGNTFAHGPVSNKYRRGIDDAKIPYEPTAPSAEDDGHVGSAESTERQPANEICSPPPALTQEKYEMQQSLSKLKELRQQAEEIAKKKEAILMAQVEKCRGMVDKLELSADSDSKTAMLQNLEAKILALQTQLRTLRDQATERAAADAASASGQPVGQAGYHQASGGYGYAGRGRGRGGRIFSGGRGYRGGYAPMGRGRFGGRGRGRVGYYGNQTFNAGGEGEATGTANGEYEDSGAGDWQQTTEGGDSTNMET